MKRYSCKNRRGATLLEFAFVAPIILLLMLGVLEFGWFAKNQLTVANATREGARAASLGMTDDNIRRRIINAALPVAVADKDIKLQYSEDSGTTYKDFPSVNLTKSPPQNGVPAGSLIKIMVGVEHRRLINIPITPSMLTAKVSMVRERS